MTEDFETIVVAAFRNEDDARKVIAELTTAERKEIVNLQDIAYIQVDSDGNVALEQQVKRRSRKRRLIGGAANLTVNIAKTGAKGLFRTGRWLTLTGGSVLATSMARRLRAVGIDDTQLVDMAGSLPRGGVTVVSVMGQNSVEIASLLMAKAGGVVTVPRATNGVRDDDGQPLSGVGEEASEAQDATKDTTLAVPDFRLTRQEQRYLKDALGKVSRSFALVIPNLEAPFRHYMAVAYLICRVVDNIEDCTQPPAWKELRFQEFHELVNEPTDARIILARWRREQWPGLTQDEAEMMGEAGGLPLWEIYAQIPDKPRASIRRWVAEMATGMVRFEGPDQDELLTDYAGLRVLTDALDYNDYCFFVAGTVGHMASELAASHYEVTDEIAQRLDATSEACGRGLQKTNILKDFAKDIERGVSYIPYAWHREINFSALELAGAPKDWTRHVIGDVVGELHAASAYVLALPYHATGYRMACLMSLLPAYQTVLLAANQHETLFTADHHVKISRPTMAKCQQDAKSMLTDNDAVSAYCDRIEQEIELALA